VTAFEIRPYSSADKDLHINCPGDLHLTVDFDYVYGPEVEAWARWVRDTLNAAYRESPPVLPSWEDESCECGAGTQADCNWNCEAYGHESQDRYGRWWPSEPGDPAP
jgi:hypothetical protein